MQQTFSHSVSAALLLSCLSLHAQTVPDAAQVPVRTLAVELAQAQKGTAAYIHTPFATGDGFYLQEKGIVVTALHTVLTPSGDVAEAIDAGIRQGRLGSISVERLAAVAQDPVHDLMLLRLANGPAALLASEEEESRAVLSPPSCESPKTVAGKSKHVERPRPVWHDVVQHTYIKHPVTTAVKQPGPAVHIVWDGPAATRP